MNMFFLLLAVSFGIDGASLQNWSGNYAPCNGHQNLLSRQHVDLGVRISTSNAVLAKHFEQAMDFWSEVIDVAWHEDDSKGCSIQLVDGAPELFHAQAPGSCACISARAQIPSRQAFQGWIAFNPSAKLTQEEMFKVSVHEIGHLLGLPHNPSGSSVMFFLELDGSDSLDPADLDALSKLHKLRPGILEKGAVTISPLTIP